MLFHQLLRLASPVDPRSITVVGRLPLMRTRTRRELRLAKPPDTLHPTYMVGSNLKWGQLAKNNEHSCQLVMVDDDGMSGAGILAGDHVVIDPAATPAHGEIVVAEIRGRLVVARVFLFNGALELRSERAGQAAVSVGSYNGQKVRGLVVGAMRAYTR